MTAPGPPQGVRALLLDRRGDVRAAWKLLFWLTMAVSIVLVGTAVLALARVDGTAWAGPALFLAAATGAGAMAARLLDERRPGALGFPVHRPAWRESAAGAGLGAGMLLATVAALAVAGSMRWVADGGTAADYGAALAGQVAFLAVAAAAEEAVFRGYPFQVLVRAAGVVPALALTSAVFAAGHLPNDNVAPLGIANIFLAGVMLGVAYLRTRSLWFATAVHLGWNWAMSFVVDLPVSGRPFDTPLYDAVDRGPAWLTGGAFGPEAGVAVTAVLLAATAWLWRTRALAPAPGTRALRPLVDDAALPEGWR